MPTTRETSGRLASSTMAFGAPIRRLAPPAKHRAHGHRPLHIPSLAAGLASRRPLAAKLIEIDDARARSCSSASRRSAPSRSPCREALGRVLAEDVTSADAVPGLRQLGDGRLRGAGRRHRAARAPSARSGSRSSTSRAPAIPPSASSGAGEAIAISTGAMLPDGRRRGRPRRGHRRRRRRGRGLGRGRARAATSAARARTSRPARRVLRRRRRARPGRARGAGVGRARRGRAARAGPRVTVLTHRRRAAGARRAAAARARSATPTPTRVAALVDARGRRAAGARDRRRRPRRDHARRSGGRSTATLVGRSAAASRSASTTTSARRSRELGVEQVFWGVALRPGKPTWFGVAPRRARSSSACPGNPVSAMVTFLLFVRPAIWRCSGRDPEPRRGRPRCSTSDYPKQPGRAHAGPLPARARATTAGTRTPTKDAGLARAHLDARRRRARDRAAGRGRRRGGRAGRDRAAAVRRAARSPTMDRDGGRASPVRGPARARGARAARRSSCPRAPPSPTRSPPPAREPGLDELLGRDAGAGGRQPRVRRRGRRAWPPATSWR